MPKSQQGITHILILLAALGLIGFILISSSSSFKDKLFGTLFPKSSSNAQELTEDQISDDDLIPDQYIVVLKEKDDKGKRIDPEIEAKEAEDSKKIDKKLHTYKHALNGYSFKGSPDQAAKLLKNPKVLSVTQDSKVHPAFQDVPTGVRRVSANGNATANINGIDERVNVNVAIIDTGIASHVELNIKGGVNCSTDNTKSPPYSDGYGHGTHVSGIVGAIDNDLGIAGVVPGANLYAVKVFGDTGGGSTSSVICGIDWVTSTRTDSDPTNDIAVANMSLGGDGGDSSGCSTTLDPEHQAICRSENKGIVYVVAAGNNGRDATNYKPASFDDVLTVSAVADADGIWGGLRGDDILAGFSNYGPKIDIAAPGQDIYSTFLDGGYANGSGTSMASPHVAGAVALYIAKNGKATTFAGVQAIMDAIKNPANGYVVPQSNPKGFTEGGNSNNDSTLPSCQPPNPPCSEPMLFIGSGNVHDIYVSGMSGPGLYLKRQSYTYNNDVSVGVLNYGNFTETPTVKLTDVSTGSVIGTQTPTIAAGGNVLLSFNFPVTPTTTLGQHILKVESQLLSGETYTLNNSATVTPYVCTELDANGQCIGAPSPTPTPSPSPTPTPSPSASPSPGVSPSPSPIPSPSGNNPPPTSPIVNLTNPTNNQTVYTGSRILITADATDDIKVTKVEFYVNGSRKSSDTSFPYLYSWSVPTTANVTYTLTAKAYDGNNNVTTSSPITVNAIPDTTPPGVAITNPLDGSNVTHSTTLPITASAFDNAGVTKVEFYINGSRKCSDTTAPYICNYNVPSSIGTQYTITTKAYDKAGNTATDSITVTSN